MTQTPYNFQARSFAFACTIVRLYTTLNKAGVVPQPLSRQLLRSGTSIGANLEEGKVAASRRDLRSRFRIALKEARETCYWLRLLVHTDLARISLIKPVLDEAKQLVAILTTSVRNLKEEGSNGNNG